MASEAIALAIKEALGVVNTVIKSQSAKLDRIAVLDQSRINYDAAIDDDLNQAGLMAIQQQNLVATIVVVAVLILVILFIVIRKK